MVNVSMAWRIARADGEGSQTIRQTKGRGYQSLGEVPDLGAGVDASWLYKFPAQNAFNQQIPGL
jgi:hypothetical protein